MLHQLTKCTCRKDCLIEDEGFSLMKLEEFESEFCTRTASINKINLKKYTISMCLHLMSQHISLFYLYIHI